jgi:hypothetical protein
VRKLLPEYSDLRSVISGNVPDKYKFGCIHIQEVPGIINRLLSFDTKRTTQKTKKLASNTQAHRQQCDAISLLAKI